MREGVLFARLGLDLIDHPRLMATPPGVRAASLGAYTYAVVYARRHETDGFVPEGAIDQLLCPQEVLQALLTVGLLARHIKDGIHGYLVVKYAEFNETKSEIEDRKAKERARWAARKQGKGTPPGVNPEHRRSPRGLLVSETETDLRERESATRLAVLSTGVGAPVESVTPLADETHRERAREQITRLAEWAKANGVDR